MAQHSDLQSHLKDRIEEVRVLKVQVRLLKESLAAKEEEAEKWKTQAFQVVQEQQNRDCTTSKEYCALMKELQQQKALFKRSEDAHEAEVRQVKSQHQKEISALRNELKTQQEAFQTDLQLLRAKIRELEESCEKNAVNQPPDPSIAAERSDQETEIKQLHDENKQLVKQNDQNAQRVIGLQRRVDALESLWLRMRSPKDVCRDKEFQERFGLNEREFIFTWYSCSLQNAAGYLYLTPSFLVFESNKVATLFQGESRLVISITDILRLNKLSGISWVPNKKNSVEITTKKETFLFKNFIKRKECMNSIIALADALGHVIATFRDGTPSVFDLRHQAEEELELSLQQAANSFLSVDE